MVFRINAITAALFSVSAGLVFQPHPAQAADNSVKVPANPAGVFDERCYSDVPPATPTEYNNTTPVEVSADKLNATRNGKAIYGAGSKSIRATNTSVLIIPNSIRSAEMYWLPATHVLDGQVTLKVTIN